MLLIKWMLKRGLNFHYKRRGSGTQILQWSEDVAINLDNAFRLEFNKKNFLKGN